MVFLPITAEKHDFKLLLILIFLFVQTSQQRGELAARWTGVHTVIEHHEFGVFVQKILGGNLFVLV